MIQCVRVVNVILEKNKAGREEKGGQCGGQVLLFFKKSSQESPHH